MYCHTAQSQGASHDRCTLESYLEELSVRRLTISVDDDLADAFEALVQANGDENRSEAFRDLLREKLGQQQLTEQPHGPCVATLSYVYATIICEVTCGTTERAPGPVYT